MVVSMFLSPYLNFFPRSPRKGQIIEFSSSCRNCAVKSELSVFQTSEKAGNRSIWVKFVLKSRLSVISIVCRCLCVHEFEIQACCYGRACGFVLTVVQESNRIGGEQKGFFPILYRELWKNRQQWRNLVGKGKQKRIKIRKGKKRSRRVVIELNISLEIRCIDIISDVQLKNRGAPQHPLIKQ